MILLMNPEKGGAILYLQLNKFSSINFVWKTSLLWRLNPKLELFSTFFLSQKLLNIVCCNNEVGSDGLDRQYNAGWHCDEQNDDDDIEIIKFLFR